LFFHWPKKPSQSTVSINNGGGGNWGAAHGGDINQIKTILPTVTASSDTKYNSSTGHRDVLSYSPHLHATTNPCFFGVPTLHLGRSNVPVFARTVDRSGGHQQPIATVSAGRLHHVQAVERVNRDDRLTTIVVGKGNTKSRNTKSKNSKSTVVRDLI